MKLNRLSIRALTLTMLLTFALVSMLVAIFMSQHFYRVALDNQRQTLERIITVAGQQSLAEARDYAVEMGAAAQKSKQLRRSFKARDIPKLSVHLGDSFAQGYVTTGLVDLAKIRIYDIKGNFVAASKEGASGLGSSMPGFLFKKAIGRSGAERLKAVGGLWTRENEAFLSMVIPVGGLRIMGYMEVVLRISHNLQSIGRSLDSPMLIETMAGKDLYRSDGYDERAESGTNLVVTHVIKGDDANDLVKVSVIEDISVFVTRAKSAEWQGVGTLIAVVVFGIILLLFMFTRFLFRPLERIEADMAECAKGDLTVDVGISGLRETTRIGGALSNMVVNLREQVCSIGEDAQKVEDSALKLAVVIGQTQENTSKQKRETEQVATAVNELAATSMEVAKNAADAEDSASVASSEADQGNRIVHESVKVIEKLADDVDQSASAIERLESDAESIGAILDVIKGIAEQTNLLALNAAIEAARAGEQGRGFAVVADEVRNLAGRTQSSTQEIQEMIERLQQGARGAVTVMEASREQAKAGVESITSAGEALQKITASVQRISDVNVSIASAAEEQSSVTEEISRNVVSVDQAADETAAGASELTISSEELKTLSTQLRSVVSHFRCKV